MSSALTLEDPGRVLHSLLNDSLSHGLRTALAERMSALLVALDGPETGVELVSMARAVEQAVGSSLDRLWLARSVIGADLPTNVEMQGIAVDFHLDGLWAALRPTFERIQKYRRHARVVIATGAITVDVGDTAATKYLSGIQRVVRETCVRWRHRPEAIFLSWSDNERHMRRLTPAESESLFNEPAGNAADDLREVLIPWQGTHLVPELVARRARTARLMPLNRYSGCEVAYIGFDCVPIMAAETVAPEMPTLFALNLAAMRYADRVATISHATAAEYTGWRRMCHGRGSLGPEVVAVPLPVEARKPSEHDLQRARRLLQLHDHPVVLVVGSHEPRKNHLAVVQAAELLWREGLKFTLAMVGAGSWRAEAYERAVAERIAAGRPLLSIRGLPDDMLWAAYHVADFTVFPSLHEGFGLPVAESLAAGTPAITSNFGSMREIVAPEGTPLGGLLVDPRDDRGLAAAMRVLLTDPATLERLTAETRQRPQRTWDDYASELWDYLVDGRAPSPPADSL